MKKQSNNYISIFLYPFSILSLFYSYFKIAPSILDDFTADEKLNQTLFSSEEAIEQFENCSFQELLRLLSNFTPISIIPHTGKPQDLDINRN
jgi:hypothetical protein